MSVKDDHPDSHKKTSNDDKQLKIIKETLEKRLRCY